MLTWLQLAHRKLDEAVFATYAWPSDLTDEQILERLLALASKARCCCQKLPVERRVTIMQIAAEHCIPQGEWKKGHEKIRFQ